MNGVVWLSIHSVKLEVRVSSVIRKFYVRNYTCCKYFVSGVVLTIVDWLIDNLMLRVIPM